MFEALKDELITQALSPLLGVVLTALAGWISYMLYEVTAYLKEKFGIDIEQKVQEIEASHKQALIDAAQREILAAIKSGEDADPRTIADRVQNYWDKTSSGAVEVLQPTREFAENLVNEGLQQVSDDLLGRIKDRLD